MKNKLNILLIAACLVVTSGCASFEKNAGKTLASVATSVDAGMKAWASWVVAGKTIPEQETKVKEAYRQYQLSMDIAKNAYVASSQTGDQNIYNVAANALIQSSSSLLQLLQSFGVAVDTTKVKIN